MRRRVRILCARWDVITGLAFCAFICAGCSGDAQHTENSDADRRDAASPSSGASRDAAPPKAVASDAGPRDSSVSTVRPDATQTPPPEVGIAVPCDGDDCLPELPGLENVVARVRGDTLLVDFSALKGARDYRVYPYPERGSVLVAKDGSVVIKDAIYRCSGDRPRPRRDRDGINQRAISLEGMIHGFMRREADALLGYVFLAPGEGRDPVYRMGDPNKNGGYTWPYAAPPGIEYDGGEFAVGAAARDTLLKKKFRDDGIAFYVPRDATRAVYRYENAMNHAVLYYIDGPEAAARSGGTERFRVLAEPAPGAVPLYRIFYLTGADHDVLAAGEANRDRVLDQGNVPFTTVVWPGMRGKTTYVVEALDQGCPFPNGLIGAKAVAATAGKTAPTITLDSARDAKTGEVFVNGQHEPANRPRAIARTYVTAEPKAAPKMDWFVGFEKPLESFATMYEDGNGIRIYHNDLLSMEFAQADTDYSYGAVLDQFFAGSSASYSLSARDAGARIAAGDYLHVTMAADIASTFRRYPQIFITDTPIDPPSFTGGPQRVITARLGPYTFEMAPPGSNHTIIVQVFGPSPELQVQFCDRRGWGVSDQCPRANIYGYHAGSDLTDWTAPWLPVPVLGEYVGLDRPVKFDVYASTKRVYVFVEDRPAGCALLPEGKMPEGDVTVVFGAAGYHIDIDEFIERQPPMHEFWSRESLGHIERRFDDLGIDSHVSLPMAWDESVLPCGDRYYE